MSGNEDSVGKSRDHSAATVPPPASTHPASARISSRALLGASREIVIEHGGREYRLRITSNGKLILTA